MKLRTAARLFDVPLLAVEVRVELVTQYMTWPVRAISNSRLQRQ